MVRKFKYFVILAFFGSCATKPPASTVTAEKPKNTMVYSTKDQAPAANQVPLSPVPPEAAPPAPLVVVPPLLQPVPPPAPVEAAPSAATFKGVPRIGIIFSAGGAKAWGHIGVLKQIEKAKWPVTAVGGLEWGSVVAGVYAHQLSSNETEWELSKVRDLDDPEKAAETIFGNRSVSDLKVPFVCSSLNVSKQEIYLLNRGQLGKLIPFCVASSSLTKPYKQSVGVLDDFSALAQHLRATGAKKIILINVLAQSAKRSLAGDVQSPENILWVQAAARADKKPAGIDDVIQIDLGDYSIKDLDRYRDIVAKAAELSYDQILKLTKKYGL